MKQKILIVEDQFIEANDIEIMLIKAGYQVTGIAHSVQQALQLISQQVPELVLVDIFLKGDRTGIDLAEILREKNIPFIFVSANSNHEVLVAAKATQPYGFIVKPFRERDLTVTLEIAQYRYENSVEAAVRKEDVLTEKLKQIIQCKNSWEEKMQQTAVALQHCLAFDHIEVARKSEAEASYTAVSFLRIGFNEYQQLGLNELQTITKTTMKQLGELQNVIFPAEEAMTFSGNEFAEMTQKPSMRKLIAEHFGMKSLLVLPLKLSNGEIILFSFYSRKPDAYKRDQLVLMKTFRSILTVAVEQMFLMGRMPAAVTARVAVNSAVSSQAALFPGIIGKSPRLLEVFDNITQVAPADTTVLILGESGTGKERIAQSIHDLSKRSKQPFIKINCAALPANLIESELFGHEKGAFTGAMDKRIGKFEMANKGTIFLDEIGEMPIELQSKLLRVLQEKEIERIGANAPVRIDVRIITATNRSLEKEVAAGRFRLDLYYRLNIFPVSLPSLRERKEDIPLLAEHFVNLCSQKLGKSLQLSPAALDSAMDYDWPGNIRELENLVERSAVIAKGELITRLHLPEPPVVDEPSPSPGFEFMTNEDNERDHIIRALKKCHGKVWGAGGAAELLDLHPSTLNSKIKKLGIRKMPF
ncbi:sigma 54-interacting transcriptional regulator [Terrimonas sp. NA20]|uniref:Sigma 54-interacting transcriptional regulator n=1 Tax=Terrimonas ginsenosidimutans TaxID=2908004 RepID=A0ABS9KRY5_9BACT|nr:sigma 54-interacting transcriptional regulator [Terrimonas ginsenosidimutans]MCG2615093.1 sigma 54-interacting transcriptional regulator [Terrimonas ginsenosidimutans]